MLFYIIKKLTIAFSFIFFSFFSSETKGEQYIQEIENHLNIALKLTLPRFSENKRSLTIKYCISLEDGSAVVPSRSEKAIILPPKSKIGFNKLAIPYNGPAKFRCMPDLICIDYYFPHCHGKSRYPHCAIIGFNDAGVEMQFGDTYMVNGEKMIGGTVRFPIVPEGRYAISITSRHDKFWIDDCFHYANGSQLIINVSSLKMEK